MRNAHGRSRLLRLAPLALGSSLILCLLAVTENSGAETGSLLAQGQPLAYLHGVSPLPDSAPVASPSVRQRQAPWRPGEVVVPDKLFGQSKLDRAVLASNPRLYLHPEFDPAAEAIVVVGMPGWGGRAENFIWTLISGLQTPELKRRLVLTAIQDTQSGGPQYQGQGARAHANTWTLGGSSVEVMNHFLATVTRQLRRPRVFFLGFSTGGVAAPVLATRLGQSSAKGRFQVAGAVALGTGSSVKAALLKQLDQRVLFITVPRYQRSDGKVTRTDQTNRGSAEISYRRLAAEGAKVQLRHIASAKRHQDWHWGLISQCRYFPGKRIDDGRGYWPNYWMPNPETTSAIGAFLLGQPLPDASSAAALAPSACPC